MRRVLIAIVLPIILNLGLYTLYPFITIENLLKATEYVKLFGLSAFLALSLSVLFSSLDRITKWKLKDWSKAFGIASFVLVTVHVLLVLLLLRSSTPLGLPIALAVVAYLILLVEFLFTFIKHRWRKYVFKLSIVALILSTAHFILIEMTKTIRPFGKIELAFAFVVMIVYLHSYVKNVLSTLLIVSLILVPTSLFFIHNQMPSCSVEEVQFHDSANDCWIVIDNVAYDVSSLNDKLVKQFCGMDFTQQFYALYKTNYSEHIKIESYLPQHAKCILRK